MFAKIVCFVVIVQTIAFAASSPFSACAPGEPTPTSITLDNCDGNQCIVSRKEQSRVVLNFVAPVHVTTARAKVTTRLGNRSYPWLVRGEGNVCKNLIHGKCPLAAGSSAAYSINLLVPSLPPVAGQASIEIRLTTSNDQVVTCTRISVLIK